MTESRTTSRMNLRWRLPCPDIDCRKIVLAVLLPLMALAVVYCALFLLPSTTAGEREALIAFYHATGGENWRVNTNWLSDEPLYTWHGVGQWPGGHVTHLELPNNGLGGSIPAALGGLTRLESLNLRGNDLSGSIPAELADLRHLQEVDLGQNRLSGSIPAELADLRHLWAIYLDGNELSGSIPAELADTRVSELSLARNQLGGCISPAFREIPRSDLAWLGLPLCGATGPPVHIDPNADRAALVALYEATGGAYWERNGNWLTDLPIVWWEGVTTDGTGRVTTLQLSYNSLRGSIPPELGTVASLEHLNLHNNNLFGRIPAELGSLSSLRELNLYGNMLSGRIPAELGGLANLEQLALQSNALSGSIPRALNRLQNLRALWLSSNDFTGCIPSRLRDVPSNDLAHLGLPYCN